MAASTPPDAAPAQDPGLVAVLAYDGLCTFEFGIAVEVFALPRPEFDFLWYDFAVVGADGPRCRALGGIEVRVDGGLELLRDARTIVVPGWRDRKERPPAALTGAIAQAAERGARVLSICSGVFVLAAAGLLEGRRATTHWRHLPTLRRAYPSLALEEDVLYVDEGNVITSAGSAAGIDACVHLVRRDFGADVANAVARRLVMPAHREGGQAQFVPAPIAPRSERSLAPLLDWARAHLDETLTVARLAEQAAMSERTLLRRFRDATGTNPRSWLQRARMERARTLLEDGNRSVERVAQACGYRSAETFRAVFRREVGIPPRAYARRFATGRA